MSARPLTIAQCCGNCLSCYDPLKTNIPPVDQHARENVVHEAGLYQGKLGFSKAIILLEEGCEALSNVQGLGQIRFPARKHKSGFLKKSGK